MEWDTLKNIFANFFHKINEIRKIFFYVNFVVKSLNKDIHFQHLEKIFIFSVHKAKTGKSVPFHPSSPYIIVLIFVLNILILYYFSKFYKIMFNFVCDNNRNVKKLFKYIIIFIFVLKKIKIYHRLAICPKF